MDTRHFALIASTLVFAACARQESIREIDWAKEALSRNPAYEIVATDETAGVFTVRDTATGVVTTLKLQDLIAAPKPAKDAARPAADPRPGITDPGPVESPDVPDDTGASALADNQTTDTVEVPPSTGGPNMKSLNPVMTLHPLAPNAIALARRTVPIVRRVSLISSSEAHANRAGAAVPVASEACGRRRLLFVAAASHHEEQHHTGRDRREPGEEQDVGHERERLAAVARAL